MYRHVRQPFIQDPVSSFRQRPRHCSRTGGQIRGFPKNHLPRYRRIEQRRHPGLYRTGKKRRYLFAGRFYFRQSCPDRKRKAGNPDLSPGHPGHRVYRRRRNADKAGCSFSCGYGKLAGSGFLTLGRLRPRQHKV